MPPKKPGRNNKKKKKSKPQDNSQANDPVEQENNESFDPFDEFPGDPTSHSAARGEHRATPGGGLYGIYKRATQRFKDGLAALVPKHFFEFDRVQALVDAVDFILDQQQKIEPELLEDCRVSLQFRKSYSKNFDGGGDEGHEYFILVLNYCYQTLRQLVPQVKQRAVKAHAKRFRFTDFEIDSDSEEEDDDDDAHAASRHPVRPEPKDFTIEELVESSDRFQACLFLFNVETCMEGVCENFRALKRKRTYQHEYRDHDDPSCLLPFLMTNAVSANISIRHVQLLEEQLELDLPHLSSVFRVIGCVFLKTEIDNLQVHLKGSGQTIPRSELTALVGDIVEQVFRLPEGRLDECIDLVVRDFCRKWSLPFDEIKKLCELTKAYSVCECQLENGTRFKFDDFSSRSWMYNRDYVGGDRNILSTLAHLQRQAQCLGDLALRLVPGGDGYGKLWDEDQLLATKIQGDMDQLLMEEILPELLLSCRLGFLSKDIPKIDELLPLFKLLKDFIANPAKPVPMSLAFGVHAILTSVFEVQGDHDVATIGTAAKNAYNLFFDQLDEQLDSDRSPFGIWRDHLNKLKPFRLLPTPLVKPSSESAEDRAFWNPCCAGMFLMYQTYFINVEHGAQVVDGIHQLRMVLQLYNAFQQRELIVGDIPLLTQLDKYFEGVQSIWEGEKPTRTGILKKFWITMGMRADVLRRLHNECRSFVINKSTQSDLLQTRDGSFSRQLTRCRPGDFSMAYRMICLRDFRETPFESDLPEAVDEEVATWNETYVRLQNNTVKAMGSEAMLVSWNLFAVGGCFYRFIHFLVDRLEWREWWDRVEAKCADTSLYSTTSMMCAAISRRLTNYILGPLELIDSVEADPLVMKARNCLVEYFFTLDSSKYKLFNTITELKKDSDDDSEDDSDDDSDSP